jgi:hypothetical protein
MAEPNRLESPAAIDPTGRDSRAETLLCQGLDEYFAGHYDNAIHIWTRVLFLDRTHSRARAYIDRARTAEAERQRRAEERLDAGYELLGQGRTSAARHLLDDVVAERGEDERASALRERIDRVEQLSRRERIGRIVDAPVSSRPAAPAGARRSGDRRPRPVRAIVVVGCVLGAVVAGAFLGPRVTGWVSRRGPGEQLVARGTPRAWPVLSTSEAALVRARTAFSGGRLAEALRDLERVSLDSPVRAEADQLRVRIQQTLVGRGPDRLHTEAGRR